MSNEPFSPTPSNRVRASQLRAKAKAGAMLSPEDAAWLADYDQARARTADARDSKENLGASKGRKISYTEEEQESVGVGDSMVAQTAAAGAMVREEGRRLDSLVTVGIAALRESVEVYKTISTTVLTQILDRNKNLEEAHVDMMRAMSKQYLARVEAEGEIARLEKETGGEEKKDGIAELAEQLMPFFLQAMGGPPSGK